MFQILRALFIFDKYESLYIIFLYNKKDIGKLTLHKF